MSEAERPARSRDSAYMRRALSLARKGWGQTAPNPMVGAVVVRDGTVVGKGFHRRFGDAHAEVEALRAAGDRARGATVYVTLEPCNHHGKTPPCTDALLAAGVARVVCATRDPNPQAGGGVERLRAAGVEVAVGVEASAARELNAPFFHAFVSDRPWVTLKLAVSLDSALADATRSRGWLTNERSRREVHRLRAGHDAVGVGIGTAIADDPALTVRAGRAPRVPPRRVVFDRLARLGTHSQLARTAREVPVTVVAERPDPARVALLEAAGVEVLVAATLPDALRSLRRTGTRSMLVEGGATLAGALLGAALVDRLIIFRAPIVLGAGALPAFGTVPASPLADAPRLPVVERRALGDDLMTVFAIRPP